MKIVFDEWTFLEKKFFSSILLKTIDKKIGIWAAYFASSNWSVMFFYLLNFLSCRKNSQDTSFCKYKEAIDEKTGLLREDHYI